MNGSIVLSIILFIATGIVTTQKFAYVSVLSSNSFLIPAKVLAYRLQKLNPSIPYIVIVTEDITANSIQELEQQRVIIHHDSKIDTPYIKTHRARKYQYTKIKLWAMTEFDVVVHLDLDVLPTRDISSLFECGSFCAVFRHSDMFNSGVFVLKTNQTIFNDMKQKVQSAVSYDGGDQGFLNTYFNELKYAPMYDPTRKDPECYNFQMKRLSAKFNYDIGMYYLNNGRFLVDPDIIHYTMGPTKPWLWWTYPLFDLNWTWLDARYEMELGSGDVSTCITLAVTNFAVIVFLVVSKMAVDRFCVKYELHAPKNAETHIVSHFIYLFAVFVAMHISNESASPVAAWVFFSSNTAWIASIVTSVYTCIRTGVSVKFQPILCCICFIMASHVVFWLILVQISHFNNRVLTAIFFILAQQVLSATFLRSALILRPCNQNYKYHVLSDRIHDS